MTPPGFRRVGMILVDERPTCPTCGHAVHVQPMDEGTSYYEPDESEIIREAADRAAPADRIDVETLAKAMQTVEPPEPAMDIVASANGFAMDWVAWARLLAAEYDRLRGSR